jgi:hypothetical protein
MLLPNRDMPYIERVLPSFAKVRTERELPRCKKSITDM